MPAGLVVPCSGPYTAAWDASILGTQNDDGYVLSCTVQGQEVNETDQFGQTLVEGVYRGQNWRVRLRGLEYKLGLLRILQTFGRLAGPSATLAPTLTGLVLNGLPTVNVGDLWTNYCGTLLLTAILGNPPTTPQSLTASNAGIAPQQTTEMMFTSKVREVPLEMVLIPYTFTFGSYSYAVPFTTI